MIKSGTSLKTRLVVLLAILAGSASALSIEQQDREFYQNQDQCDKLYRTKDFHYKFNENACACFFVLNPPLKVDCPRDKPYFNPLHEAGNKKDLCITKKEAEAIFDHHAGEDCIPGTDDDPHAN